MKRNEKVLVTGGAGYIGSIACELLIKDGYEVVVVDDLTEGNEQAVTEGAAFYEGNFGDQSILDEIFTKYTIKIVFHFAASANVPDSVIDPEKYYHNNFVNTLSLLGKMKQYGVDKIIFSSTAAVFGEPVYLPIDENHPEKPINPYGHSKLMIEQVIKDYAHAYGLKYIIFRYFCAAGATEDHGESRKCESHLIPVVLDFVLGKREIVNVFGNKFNTVDGSGVRDYIHVVDIARAHILGMKQFEQASGNSFNLGTNAGFSVLEIIAQTQAFTNHEIRYQIVPMRPGDPATLVAGNEKAKTLLGWVPEFDIKDIILSAFRWRQHPKY